MTKFLRIALILTLMGASHAYADQYSALYAGGDPIAGKALLQKTVFRAMQAVLVEMARRFIPVKIDLSKPRAALKRKFATAILCWA
jgi:hypothetical protein